MTSVYQGLFSPRQEGDPGYEVAFTHATGKNVSRPFVFVETLVYSSVSTKTKQNKRSPICFAIYPIPVTVLSWLIEPATQASFLAEKDRGSLRQRSVENDDKLGGRGGVSLHTGHKY